MTPFDDLGRAAATVMTVTPTVPGIMVEHLDHGLHQLGRSSGASSALTQMLPTVSVPPSTVPAGAPAPC